MDLPHVFKIFRIRHFLTRIPLPSRSIASSKNLILQHALASQSQTSCMDLDKQWNPIKSKKIRLCAYNTHLYCLGIMWQLVPW
jgi:hypothetical protein